jgi:ribose 5-phosphate isomerase B
MTVYLGTDHAGLQLKNTVKNVLQEKGYSVEDCGAYEFDKDDDYPDFIGKAAQQVSLHTGSMGIVFGGSGQGEAIVANKYKDVRCSLFYTPAVAAQAMDIAGNKSEDPFEMLKLTRAHNDSNMLSLGSRFLTEEQAIKAVLTFLEAPFSNEERHVRRIEKVKKIEER